MIKQCHSCDWYDNGICSEVHRIPYMQKVQDNQTACMLFKEPPKVTLKLYTRCGCTKELEFLAGYQPQEYFEVTLNPDDIDSFETNIPDRCHLQKRRFRNTGRYNIDGQLEYKEVAELCKESC